MTSVFGFAYLSNISIYLPNLWIYLPKISIYLPQSQDHQQNLTTKRKGLTRCQSSPHNYLRIILLLYRRRIRPYSLQQVF
jgi:hypothetical protein